MSVRPPLTPEQEAVVTDPRERLFVRACPGSGKTRTVVERFLFRAGAITSRHGVAALSFSRRATKEIRQRCIAGGLERLLGFPHYVGTLDGFFFRYVFRPFEQARTKRRVQVVDSWDAIGAKVKVRGVQSGGVSLDAFPVVNGRPTFELARVRGNDFAIGKEIARDPGPWEASAARYLQHLSAKGIYSCDEVRKRVQGLLASGALASVLLPALAARFAEVIVDEAQDCDEAQIGLLEALATAGVRLVVVADPEQAIYEFRAARPDLLHALTAGMAVRELTGNHRSTPAICALANSMRASALPPMTAVGKHRDTRTPVYVIPYAGSSVDEAPALLTAAALGDGDGFQQLRTPAA